MTTQGTLELGHLSESYDIIGELSGRADARTYMGRRRQDGADVLITVFQQPAKDEGNALSHLAADVNLLAGQRHRAIVPVLAGEWIGNDAFAIVTERPTSPTLDELLARRDEEFDYPRIALVLQEVNGALEWARAHKVVHRQVTPDTIFAEPGSDRIQVAFTARALPLADMPGEEDDARTIALLARQMLTRSSMDPERANQPLAELRPGLPKKVVEQTEALLGATRSGDAVPDVRGYIAAVAMSESLKRGESECANTIKKMLHEEQQARAEIEAKRQQCELTVAQQQRELEKTREDFEDEKARILKSFAKTREEFEKERAQILRSLEKEREKFAKEKAEIIRSLAKERAEVDKERAEVDKERAEVDKERAALATHLRELEHRGQQIESQQKLYERTAELRTPASDAMPVVVPMAGSKQARRWKLPRVRLPRPSFSWLSVPRVRAPRWRREWNVPAAAVGLLLVITLSALALRGGGGDRTPTRSQAPAQARGLTIPRVQEASGGVSLDSVSTTTTSPAGVPNDLLSGVSTRAAAAPAVRAPQRRRPPIVAPVDTMGSSVTTPIDSAPRADTLVRSILPPTRLDSLPRPTPGVIPPVRDTIRRDTISRRDSIPRDTIRRDTLVRRDTSVTR